MEHATDKMSDASYVVLSVLNTDWKNLFCVALSSAVGILAFAWMERRAVRKAERLSTGD